jgi:hypothetical protein
MNPYRSSTSKKSTDPSAWSRGWPTHPARGASLDALFSRLETEPATNDKCWQAVVSWKDWTSSQVTRCVHWLMTMPDDSEKGQRRWDVCATLVDIWYRTQPALVWTAVMTTLSVTPTQEETDCSSSSLLLKRLHQQILNTATPNPAILRACASIWWALDALQGSMDVSYDSDTHSKHASSAVPWWLQEAYISSTAMQLLLQWSLTGIFSSSSALKRGSAAALLLKEHPRNNYTSSCIYVVTHLLQHYCPPPSSRWPIELVLAPPPFETDAPSEDKGEQQHWILSRVVRPVIRILDEMSTHSICRDQQELENALRCFELWMALHQQQRHVATEYHSLWTDPWRHVLENTEWISFLLGVITKDDRLPMPQNYDAVSSQHAFVDTDGASLRSLCLSILRYLHATNPNIISQRLSAQQNLALQVRNFVQRVWNAVLSPNVAEGLSEQEIESFLLLHRIDRALVRRTVLACLSQEGSASTSNSSLLQGLVHLLQWSCSNHSLAGTVLLQQLLMDRCHALRHDELSRLVWQEMSDPSHQMLASELPGSADASPSPLDFIGYCWNCIQGQLPLRNSTFLGSGPSLECYPLILIQLLDILYVLLQGCPKHRCKLLLSAETVERFTRLLPLSDAADLEDPPSANAESCTPTAQNLSRCLDVSTVMMEKPGTTAVHDFPEASAVVAVGCGGPFLAYAVATLCALLGQSPSSNETEESDQVYLRQRLLDAAFSFVMRSNTSFLQLAPTSSTRDIGPSRDLTRRRFRLLVTLAQAENEEYLTDILYSAEQAEYSKVLHMIRRLDQCTHQLNESRHREEQLRLEQESFSTRLLSQSTGHQSEVNELRRHLTQSANALVEIHVLERKKAEAQEQKMSQSLTEARSIAETCRESERSIRVNLQETTERLQQITNRAEEFAIRAQQQQKEKEELEQELRTTRQSLHDARMKHQVMQDEMREQEDRLQHFEHSETEVRNSLENLFGDMVSLAHLFVEKEKEVERFQGSYEAQVADLERRLKLEQERSAKLEAQDEKRQYDLSILTRKYQRAKEKLENAEQQLRKSAAEPPRRYPQSGPISYMNQLHATSSANSKASSDRNGSSNDAGKENSSSTASFSNAFTMNSRPSKRDLSSRR